MFYANTLRQKIIIMHNPPNPNVEGLHVKNSTVGSVFQTVLEKYLENLLIFRSVLMELISFFD